MKTGSPQTMKAVVLTKPGKFEIQEVPVPAPGPGEVLCKIKGVTICGSDPEIIRGDLAGYWPPSYPFIAGHEWSGEVVTAGEGVLNLRPGDRVAGEVHKGCGQCVKCLEGRYNLCENYAKGGTTHRHYGFINNGAYAQYNSYLVNALHKLPDKVSFREGALVETAGVVAHGLSLTGITPGGTVVVLGPGPIGLITMRMARLMGAATIIAVGRPPRLELAARLCANIIIDFEKEDPAEAVKAIAPLGVDEAFECSGAPGTFHQAVIMVKRGGRVGLLGVPQRHVEEKLPFAYIVSNEIAIFGSKANPNVSKKIISLVSAGQLVLKDLVTHTFTLEDFGEALEAFTTRRNGALKVVIEPNRTEDGK